MRIQRQLDLLHDANRIQAQLLDQTLLLAQPDAVLARTRALHLQRPLHHPRHALLDLLLLSRVFAVVHDALMEIAVAHVAQRRGEEAEFVHFALAHFDDVGQAGQRDRDVGGPDLLVAFAEGQHGPEGFLARRPQLFLLVGVGGEFERAGSALFGEVFDQAYVFPYAGFCA